MKFSRFLYPLAALLFLLPTAVACADEEVAELVPPASYDKPEETEEETTEETVPDGETQDGAEREETDEETGSPEEEPPAEPSTPPAEEPEVSQEEVAPAKAEYLLVQASALNVRTGAGTSYTALGQAQKGTLLAYDGKTGSWYRTLYRNRGAYVSASSAHTVLVTMETGSEEVERVIEEGLKLLGTPYVYGATRLHDGTGKMLSGFTVTKFDCSSLMQYIFYQGAGTLLNGNSRSQSTQGVSVSKANIRRGDLLFFTNSSRVNNTGIERIGHVALYLGENYILHTSSDFAKIEQISAQRWSYFITARRVL